MSAKRSPRCRVLKRRLERIPEEKAVEAAAIESGIRLFGAHLPVAVIFLLPDSQVRGFVVAATDAHEWLSLIDISGPFLPSRTRCSLSTRA